MWQWFFFKQSVLSIEFFSSRQNTVTRDAISLPHPLRNTRFTAATWQRDQSPHLSLCCLDTQTVPCSVFMLLANELRRDVVQVSIGRDVRRELTATGERHCFNYKHIFEERWFIWETALQKVCRCSCFPSLTVIQSTPIIKLIKIAKLIRCSHAHAPLQWGAELFGGLYLKLVKTSRMTFVI